MNKETKKTLLIKNISNLITCNDEDKEFIFTNLNLLRKAKLENSLKNKNHTKKTQKNISNSNRLKSPNKTSELPFQKKLNEKEIKLRNTLKEKNVND